MSAEHKKIFPDSNKTIPESNKTIVLSLGGSLIAPDKPDYFFLREFKNFIVKNINNYRFIIVCGGGKTNFYYNESAKKVSNISKTDLDRIGIMATRLNAELVRSIFGSLAYKKVFYSPLFNLFKIKKRIIVVSGWKPGWSTDYVAVLIAKKISAKIFNLSNIDYVYDNDPKKNKNAKKFFSIKWKDYRRLISRKWVPRMSSPFDPIASKEAEKSKIPVLILNGKNFENLEKAIKGEKAKGTLIAD